MGYRQTWAVYTRRSGSVQIHPDRPPISVRAGIGSNSNRVRMNHKKTGPDRFSNFCDLNRSIQYLVQ